VHMLATVMRRHRSSMEEEKAYGDQDDES
jgi:hypothetical protein